MTQQDGLAIEDEVRPLAPAGRLGAPAASPARSRRMLADTLIGLAAAASAWLLLEPLSAGFATLWWVAVAVVIRSDLDRFIIPDRASIAIAALGLAHAATLGRDGAGGLEGAAGGLLAALIQGGAALALFWAVAWTFRRRTGRDGLGFGDVKLAGASAIWLDFGQQAAALETACVAAIAVVLLCRRDPKARRAAIPFGAFLAPSAWLVLVFGPVARALLERVG